MKKWARIFLALILVATLSLGGVLPASAKQFQDVTRSGMGEEIFDSINYVSDNGILVGTTSTQFGPNTTLTRAMIVAVLYRWSGDGGSYSNPFTDVYKSDYYYDAVGWAQQNGIVYGTTATQFSPAKPVTTEQFFAFLYRYALKYHPDKTDYTEASITSHPDYSSVLEYARPSFRWAKQHHILQLANFAYLAPQASMLRKNVALYITRYSLQVKGFDEEDRFSFVNLSNSKLNAYAGFSAVERMSETLYELLLRQINTNAGSSAAATAIDLINKHRNKEFTGACFGMSAVTYLNKIGKIDFCKNTAGRSPLSHVPFPKYNLTVEGSIFYYQYTQWVTRKYATTFTGKSILDGLNKLEYVTKTQGPVILGIAGFDPQGYDFGHSVILISCELTPSGYYNVSYLDPNYRGIIEDTFDVELTSNSILSIKYENYSIMQIEYFPRSEMKCWDTYDFDGIYNTNTYAGSKTNELDLTIADLPSDTAYLCLYARPFKIVNASGQTLEYDGQHYSGNIEILDTMTSMNGIGHPNTLILQVPYSSSFCYESLSDVASFSVSTQAYSGSAYGEGIESITINSSRRILLSGKEMDVYASGRLIQQNLEYLSLQGKADQNAIIEFTENGAEISGIYGDGVLSAMHCNNTISFVDRQYSFTSGLTAVDTISSQSSMQVSSVNGEMQ